MYSLINSLIGNYLCNILLIIIEYKLMHKLMIFDLILSKTSLKQLFNR
jgi:hypothetical protein